jgi:hypothetical protein
MPPGPGICGAGAGFFMSRLFKTLFLASALAAACAHADEAPAPAPAKPAVQPDDFYIGIGVFSDMANVNVETMTRWGNFKLRAGHFQDNEHMGFNLSWRKPLSSDDEEEEASPNNGTGYYIGLFGGHVAGEKFVGEDRLRLGVGAEMGHQWVTDYRRSELTVGLGVPEPLEERGAKLAAEPTIFFSFSIALGY